MPNSKQLCPTCGHEREVFTSESGTSGFVPPNEKTVTAQLPTDDEIYNHWKRRNCFGQYAEGLRDGSKWMRDIAAQQTQSLREEVNRLRALTTWIPVEERLPEPGQRVLCKFMDPIIPSVKVDELIDIDGYRRGAVSHWMPLPQPPKQQ